MRKILRWVVLMLFTFTAIWTLISGVAAYSTWTNSGEFTRYKEFWIAFFALLAGTLVLYRIERWLASPEKRPPGRAETGWAKAFFPGAEGEELNKRAEQIRPVLLLLVAVIIVASGASGIADRLKNRSENGGQAEAEKPREVTTVDLSGTRIILPIPAGFSRVDERDRIGEFLRQGMDPNMRLAAFLVPEEDARKLEKNEPISRLKRGFMAQTIRSIEGFKVTPSLFREFKSSARTALLATETQSYQDKESAASESLSRALDAPVRAEVGVTRFEGVFEDSENALCWLQTGNFRFTVNGTHDDATAIAGGVAAVLVRGRIINLVYLVDRSEREEPEEIKRVLRQWKDAFFKANQG